MILTYLKTDSLVTLFVLLFLLFVVKSYSQDNNMMHTINASGSDVSGNSGSVTYSIGQVFFSHKDNNNYQMSEGIQQGILEGNSNNEDSDIPEEVVSTDIEILIYPNPTTDYVTLKSGGFEYNNELSSYQLYNYQGKLLQQNIIQQTNTQIDLSHLSSSIYLLQVFVEEKLWKTFKILKQ